MKLLFDEKTHKYTGTDIDIKSVTQVLQRLAKPALIPAAVKATVEYIRDNNIDLTQETAVKEAKGAYRKQWDEKANIGTMVHYGMELLAEAHTKHNKANQLKMEKAKDKAKVKLKELPVNTVEKLFPKVIKKFNSEFEITPEMKQKVKVGMASGYKLIIDIKDIKFLETEKRVSKGTLYAGSIDAIIEINNKVYAVDYKTGNTYPEYILQLAAYADCLAEEYGNRMDGAIIIKLHTDEVKHSNDIIQMEGVVTYAANFRALIGIDTHITHLEKTLKKPNNESTNSGENENIQGDKQDNG